MISKMLTRSSSKHKLSTYNQWSIRALEPRLLLAGDAGAAIADVPATQTVETITGDPKHLALPANQVHRGSIVFIDSEIQDFDQLADSVLGKSEVVLLDANVDGITQITQHLAKRLDVQEIHLVGHGHTGQIKLGSSIVDASDLNERTSELRNWSRSLTADADILVYGCETGSGTLGEAFVDRLAKLTGADVAASTDATGNQSQNGDWEFERTTGLIQASVAFDQRVLENYQHVMPITIRAAGVTNDETMQLLIDGQVVQTFLSVGGDAYAGVYQDYTYNGPSVSADRVRVAFNYAFYDPANNYDQNLRVDSITIDGTTYQTEDPSVFSTGTWKPEDGIVPGFRQSEFLHDNGYFQYASVNNGSTIVVSASGAQGPENFDLQIDGNTVASFSNIGTNQQDFFYQSNDQVTADRIRVAFTNDAYNPSAGIDYNLNVDKITVDGVEFQTEDPSVFSTGTWLPADGVQPGNRQSETLHTNGYFQYGVSSPPLNALRINAGGGDYTDSNGNFWQADAYYDSGSVFQTTDPVFQTNDDILYQTERWNENLSYNIPVENGAYQVNLHFAEIFFTDFGQRSFDVSVENGLVEDDLDIFERAKNAFFPGDDNALVIDAGQYLINDGVLDLDMSASVNNAKISAIEIIPIQGSGVLVLPTAGAADVTEGGNGDTYQVRLNAAPTSNVNVSLQFDSSQINVSQSNLTFTPQDWQTPKTVFVSAIDDSAQEGTQTLSISHSVSSADGNYNGISVADLAVVVTDNDVVPIQYVQTTVASVTDPTTAAWGPDGRLYVGSTNGVITALTFNDNNQVTNTQQINTLAGLSNNNILGIAFNPFDDPNSPQIYVAHSQLFANGGSSFPETELSPYSGQVSVLSGNNFSNAQALITGLPVSNHDHGINGMQFDNAGDLYIAVGGNTNAGVENSNIGGIPESPFAAAVLKADITTANFNGAIEYVLNPGFNPPSGLTFDAEDSQTFGDQVSVVPGLDVSVYSSGLRNPYDLIFTTSGLLYATDNGPNAGFGAESTGPNSESTAAGGPDELNLLAPDAYFGHPNRTRGVGDFRQNIYYSAFTGSTNDYTAPIATVSSSTNGIDEIRSEVFDGQLKGQLILQEYNGAVFFVELAPDGFSVQNVDTVAGIADGLDVLMGPGGTIFGIDFAQDRITVGTPVDPTVTTAKAYDISVWRAPSSGGTEFTIGGVNFGNLSNTSVTIGGQSVQLTSVSGTRIRGILPAFVNPGAALLDVVVNSNGSTSVIEDAFLPLA